VRAMSLPRRAPIPTYRISVREHGDLRAGLYPSGILRRIAGDRVSHGGHGVTENFLAIDQSLDAGFNLNSKIDSIYLLQLLL
jgi:hypothetical protein